MDTEEIFHCIHDWVLQNGLRVRATDDPETTISLTITDLQGKVCTVAQPKSQGDVLFIGATITFDREALGLNQMSKIKRDQLVIDMRIELLRLGVQLHGLDESFESITVISPIYYDGFSKDTFSTRISVVVRAMELLGYTVDRALLTSRPRGGSMQKLVPNPVGHRM